MGKKKFSHKSSKLTIEQEFLLRQEKELLQKEALLKRRLQKLPSLKRNTKVIHTTFAAADDPLPGMLPQKERRRSAYRGLPMREKRAAKIKFVVLVIILTFLLILIWRSLPV